MSEEAALTLYTIGHSNLTLDKFVELLHQHRITVLVDVRSRPVSKYVPHFNKDSLEKTLPQHSIEYRFAGKHLGGQPDDESVYLMKQAPNSSASREDFREDIQYPLVMKLDGYQKGIYRLLEIMRETQGRVAVMCSEVDPRKCHRHDLITRSLIDPNLDIFDVSLRVIHILHDGNAETVDPEEFDRPTQRSLFEGML